MFRTRSRQATWRPRLADEKQQRAALRVALSKDCRKIPGGGDAAQNARDLELSRQALGQAASRSSAPISTAASASRLRAPRIFSSVAAWRVTRLIAASAFRCSAPASGGESRRNTRSTGLAVDRLIIERLGEPREQAVNLLQALDLAVRDRDALAEPGRTELLALGEAREDRRRVELEPLAGEIGELLQQRLLAAARKARLDRVEIEEIGKMHRRTRSRGGGLTAPPVKENRVQAVRGSTQPMFPSSRR